MKKISITDNISLFDTNTNTDVLDVKYFYWGPNATIIKTIEQLCMTNKYDKILEIGPGTVPFNLATEFIGCNETIKHHYIDIDIDKELFPYEDKQIDFIFCRHVLEDIQNPDFALSEIFRTCKSGYIETPSPLIEITKNVDIHSLSNMYCGYIHHRYIVWSNIKKNEIYFLPKYSCILDHMLNSKDSKIYLIINKYPVYWNNYFLYDNKDKPTVIMYKNGVNFNLTSNMIEDYIQLVNKAVNESIENTNYFVRTYCH